jgi:hypothetical protein
MRQHHIKNLAFADIPETGSDAACLITSLLSSTIQEREK